MAHLDDLAARTEAELAQMFQVVDAALVLAPVDRDDARQLYDFLQPVPRKHVGHNATRSAGSHNTFRASIHSEFKLVTCNSFSFP